MKNVIIIIVLFCALQLYSQTPSMKIYLGDGSQKSYNLTDLENINITKNQSNVLLKIYSQNNQIVSQSTSGIDSIKFESNQNSFTSLLLYITGSAPQKYPLSKIDSINFYIQTASSPVITSIIPASAKIGDEITISGKNFGANQGSSLITFGTIKASIYSSWNDNEIKVKVPSGAVSGNLSVTVNGIVSNDLSYTIINESVLKVLSINPVSSKIGDTLTISGLGFGSKQVNSFVSFNAINGVSYTLWSDTEVKVIVPPATVSGKLSLTVNNIKSNEIDFVIISSNALIILNIAPSAFNVGDIITINGSGFDSTRKTSYVSFGGKNALEYSSWTNSQIKVKAPIGILAGKLSVVVGSKTSNEIEYALAPKITKVKPDSAAKGDFISISGITFGMSKGNNTVSFNDLKATEYQLWSDTLINVQVPETAKSGKISVTINGNKSNEVSFTLIHNLISIAPASLFIGDEITLTGTNFGNQQDSNYVLINNLKVVNFTTWSDSIVKLIVPESTISGKISITIANKKSKELNFIILPKLLSVSPTSAKIGSSITLTGNSFGTERGSSYVSFNGVKAIDYISWSETSIVVNVPLGSKSGKISVFVSNKKSNELDFKLLLSISGCFPNNGLVGDQIRIFGVSLGDSRGTSFVLFNGIQVIEYVAWSDSIITCQIPPGASSGKLLVNVAGVASNEIDFILKPVITNISPSEAPIGAQVTITGLNFGDSRNSNFVIFPGTTDCTYQSWSSSSIVVIVPQKAKAGKIYVNYNGVVSNEMQFTTTTVLIGSQEWAVRNLNVTTYRNGDPIPEVQDQNTWNNLTTGAWCYYQNDTGNEIIYGKLYNWYAINDSRGLGPSGWHVATEGDWTTLVNYYNGLSTAGGPLKEVGTDHWTPPNTGATNESGFTGLGGGIRANNGFSNVKNAGTYWSSTQNDATTVWSFYLFYTGTTVTKAPNLKYSGLAIRLVKD